MGTAVNGARHPKVGNVCLDFCSRSNFWGGLRHIPRVDPERVPTTPGGVATCPLGLLFPLLIGRRKKGFLLDFTSLTPPMTEAIFSSTRTSFFGGGGALQQRAGP